MLVCFVLAYIQDALFFNVTEGEGGGLTLNVTMTYVKRTKISLEMPLKGVFLVYNLLR